MDLKNTTWMFHADFATFYQDRYEFVKFNDENEIEYLNEQGGLIRKDAVEMDEDGNYTMKDDPFFKGIEFKSSNEINLVFESEHFENDKSVGLKKMRFNLTRLTPTKVEASQKTLMLLSSNSEWRLAYQNERSKKAIKLSKWKAIPKEEKEKALSDPKIFSSYKTSTHLIKIDETLILIRQRLGMVKGKAMVLKISENEIVVNVQGREQTLKRVE